MRLFRTTTLFAHRQLSEPVTLQTINQSAVLNVITWSPSKKVLDSQHQVINRTSLTSLQAKKLLLEPREKNVRIEPYGHAAAKLLINLKDPNISKDIIQCVQTLTKLSNSQFIRMTSLECYISWFPKSDVDGLIMTGREIESSEQQALAIKLRSENDDINLVKGRILSFLAKEYKAQGSDYASDVSQYGTPDVDRTLCMTDLDFISIIESVFKMMSHKILPQNIITMDDVLPDATYYGLDLLLQHTPLLHTRPYSELSPVHVCTTAVLRLLKAGIGIDKYNEILNKVVSSDPELSHGFPIVDITHAIAQEIYQRESVKSFSHKT